MKEVQQKERILYDSNYIKLRKMQTNSITIKSKKFQTHLYKKFQTHRLVQGEGWEERITKDKRSSGGGYVYHPACGEQLSRCMHISKPSS